jgi:glycosyltransferase involved in cell wall biosynthesis
MKSRVLFLDHAGVLGGAELAILDVARAYRETSTVALFADGPFRRLLASEGIRVEVVAGSPQLHAVKRETRWPGFAAVGGLLSLVARLVPLARRHDCIHANSQKAFVTACLVGVVARRPVVWDLNDLLTPEHFSRANIRVDVALSNLIATRLIANSQATADAFVASGGRADKLSVVHNGISSKAFDAVTDQAIEDARREFGLDGHPVVGIFSRLGEWKGQDVAIDALPALPGVRLLLVGDALFGEESYAAGLRQRAAALGVADRVTFLGFRSDVPRLMRLVDIVAHTSSSAEPFGRVVVEGMLAERPVVATRAGGVPEIIQDGVTGVLVTPGSVEAFAAAVRDLLADPGRARRIAQAGRAHATTHFTVEAMVDQKTVLLEQAVRRRASHKESAHGALARRHHG